MKFKVLSPIRNNGKFYPVNSEISLKEVPEALVNLLEETTETKKSVPKKEAAKSTAKKKTISKKQ